jgi:hypothetical protein
MDPSTDTYNMHTNANAQIIRLLTEGTTSEWPVVAH